MAPRYSIIPGRFVDDARPTLMHFKIILALGRRTNRAGWCFVSQTKLAKVMGICRQSVSSAISDLVKWGYVEKKSQAETHRAICQYRVLLDGGSADDDEPDDGVGDVSPGDDTSNGGDVSPVGDTGVASQATGGVAYEATPVTTPRERPHTHNGARARDLLEHASGRSARVVDLVLRPLAGILTPSSGIDQASLLAEIASSLDRRSDDVLVALRDHLRDTRSKWPSVARINDAADEIERAKPRGARVTVGTEQWIAWDRWLHVHEGSARRLIHVERHGAWTVPTEWPPVRYSAEAYAEWVASRSQSKPV